MKNRTTNEIIMTIVFIVLLPLIILEIMIKKPNELISRVRLSYQLMLFIIGFGRKQSIPTVNQKNLGGFL